MKKACAILSILFVLACADSVYFSNITTKVSGTSAVITWNTNISCSAQVKYGKNATYTHYSSNSTNSLFHLVRISGLSPNQSYHYMLQCRINYTHIYNSTDRIFTTTEALPDLVVSFISATPQQATLGNNISVNVYVRNNGESRASNISVSVLCADGKFQNKTISSISPYSSSTVSITCPPPSVAGKYTITAVIDKNNEIRESDENNNNAYVNVSYVQSSKPDLIITDADITYEFREYRGNTSLLLRVYVRNNGTARAENVWVKITGENTTYHKISSISPQGRGYINLWLPLPAHEISVIAIADPNNTISELNETNNIANRSIKKVSALPDLSVSEADVTHLPSNPKSGSAVVVSAKIRNYGISIARNITVCFYKADEPHAYEKENWESDEVIILNWDRSRLADLLHEIKRRKGDSAIFGEMLANYTINAIAPNSSQIAKAVVSLPQNASSMRIAVILDPENYIMEASEENNRAIHEIPIEVVYADLMLNSSSISFSPQYATAGNRVLISATVRNNGSLTARNITAFLYFLAGAKEYELVGNTTIPVIPAKGVGTVKFEWTAPRDVKAASFRVEVNPDRRTPESDYRNNIAEKNLTILLPDVELSGKDIWVVGNVSVGNQVWIKANVSNNGNFTARDFDTEFIYVSPSGVETPIGTKTATISAGGTETVSIQWKVPERISANPIIVVRANPSHSLSELDYDNNVGTITLNASLPDIVLSLSANKQNATIPTAPDRRNWVVLSAIVRNIGNAKAHNISVYIMKNGEKIWEEIIPVLNAGENATVNYNFAVLSTMPAGEHFFSAVADQHNAISEINENNNYAEMSLLFVENMRPTAVINADKTNVMKRELITFNCLNSTDPDGKGPFTCRWNFGDGSEVVEGHEVYHSYSASGGYIVVLTVTDSYGAKDSEILRITVQPNKPPIANIGGPYIPYVNEEAYFSPLDSYDPDGEIVLVSWDFGDGSGVETHGFYPVSHTYSNIGTYILKITVTDDSGATSTASTAVIPIYPPEMETKRSTEYYVSHTRYYYSVPSSAYIYYGVYRIDYELKYTPDDNVIRSLKYTIYSGPAIVTTVVDTRASVLFWDIPVTTTTGWTALSVKNVKIVDADGNLLWSAVGGPSINGVERNATMSYTNIEVPIDFSKSNYVTVVSDIDYPANMCAAEHYDCQSNKVALWRI